MRVLTLQAPSQRLRRGPSYLGTRRVSALACQWGDRVRKPDPKPPSAPLLRLPNPGPAGLAAARAQLRVLRLAAEGLPNKRIAKPGARNRIHAGVILRGLEISDPALRVAGWTRSVAPPQRRIDPVHKTEWAYAAATGSAQARRRAAPAPAPYTRVAQADQPSVGPSGASRRAAALPMVPSSASTAVA
ncbi:hypothetical protein LDO31_10480 [Luteimonas sp. XNQY3]|nr:hypothetical protein [Luteimonas sp. XNQY3]MCD9006655.1 hypothetical protein [Luteimonas sp. XNQY3]